MKTICGVVPSALGPCFKSVSEARVCSEVGDQADEGPDSDVRGKQLAELRQPLLEKRRLSSDFKLFTG